MEGLVSGVLTCEKEHKVKKSEVGPEHSMREQESKEGEREEEEEGRKG